MKGSPRFFSLIEILVAVALIAILAGALAINVRGIINEQLQLNELARVQNLLTKAKELTLAADVDVELKFIFKKDFFEIHFIPMTPPPLSLNKAFKTHVEKLEYIKGIEFEDVGSQKIFKAGFSLRFFKKGYAPPIGVLRFYTREGVWSLLLLKEESSFQNIVKGDSQFPVDRNEREFLESVSHELRQEIGQEAGK